MSALYVCLLAQRHKEERQAKAWIWENELLIIVASEGALIRKDAKKRMGATTATGIHEAGLKRRTRYPSALQVAWNHGVAGL